MPRHDRRPDAADGPEPSSELVLAALERAARHARRAGPGVRAGTVLEHLGVAAHSRAARVARARLRELRDAGAVREMPYRGRALWSLTGAGSRRLHGARTTGGAEQLPEAPQHWAWRTAGTLAALEIERFRDDLDAFLGQARELLAREPCPHSDAWFELAERLQRAAWRVGAATHCLCEWPEPSDARADVDDLQEEGDAALSPTQRERLRALRAGRRNAALWR